jgi:hypothetical protein
MKKVKEDVFEERKDGCLEFKIWGRPDYTLSLTVEVEKPFTITATMQNHYFDAV